MLPHPQGTTIGAGVVLGRNVRLLKNVSLGIAGRREASRDGYPVINDDCILYDSASVFGPVEVGAASTLGVGVHLFESVPPNSVVAWRQELEIRTREPAHHGKG